MGGGSHKRYIYFDYSLQSNQVLPPHLPPRPLLFMWKSRNAFPNHTQFPSKTCTYSIARKNKYQTVPNINSYLRTIIFSCVVLVVVMCVHVICFLLWDSRGQWLYLFKLLFTESGKPHLWLFTWDWTFSYTDTRWTIMRCINEFLVLSKGEGKYVSTQCY